MSNIPSYVNPISFLFEINTATLVDGSVIIYNNSSKKWVNVNQSSLAIFNSGLSINKGGTGATTSASAINNLLPSQSGKSGKYLSTDGSNPYWATVTASAGSSTFIGLTDVPASYSGNGLKVVRVNSGGTGLEFFTLSGGGDALVSNTLAQFAPTTSAQLASVITNETGSGSLVFNTSPTFITPVLGAATATSINNISLTTASSASLTIPSGTHTLAAMDVAQTWTAVQTFTTGNFKLKNSITNSLTILNASLTAANTISFGNLSGTVALKDVDNGFQTTQSFYASNAISIYETSYGLFAATLSNDNPSGISASHTLYFPDADGVLVVPVANQIWSGIQTFNDTKLLLRNSVNTFSTTISASNATATRTITFPDITGTVYVHGEISPGSIGSDQTALSLGVGSFIRLTSSSNYAIGGFSANDILPGRVVRVCNIGYYALRIKHQDSGATASNRIITPYGLDWPMRPLDVFTFMYDNTTSRWRLISGFERILLDPKYAGEVFTDFNDSAQTYMYNTTSGGGALQANNSVSSTQWGVSRLNTTTTNAYAALHGNSFSYIKHGGVFECTVAIETLGTTNEQFKVILGFASAPTGVITPADGVYFLYDQSVSTQWQCVTRTSGAQTATTAGAGTAPVANTFQHFRIVINSSHTAADFYIGDMSNPVVSAQATNFPAAGNILVYQMQGIKTNSVSGTITNSLLYDSLHVIRLDYLSRY